jgi:hypothetical protein
MKKFELAEIEVVRFSVEDVIATSVEDTEPTLGPTESNLGPNDTEIL